MKFHSFTEYVTIQSHELTNKSFWKTQPLTLDLQQKPKRIKNTAAAGSKKQKNIIAPKKTHTHTHTTKRQKHILCSIQASLTKQLTVKVHSEKQAGWCQGRCPWERDQGGTGLKRTQLGPRWASETLGHLLPKRCLLSGNPLQKPQEIRGKNSMQSKTSLFIEMISLR